MVSHGKSDSDWIRLAATLRGSQPGVQSVFFIYYISRTQSTHKNEK